jgi:hypothetical protein
VDGAGRSAFVRHDAVNSGDNIFLTGYSHRAIEKDDWRRPAKQARGAGRVILETLFVETERPASLRKDVLGRYFEMSKAQVMFQLWEMMKHNKKYWLLPVIIVLVLIGALFVVAQSSALAPFIYSLF